MKIRITPSLPQRNYTPKESRLRTNRNLVRPPLFKPYAVVSPAVIVDWGIVDCYAIPIRYVSPAGDKIIAAYIHYYSGDLSVLPGQLQEIRRKMATLGMEADPELEAVATGVSLPNPIDRINRLEGIAQILMENGIAKVEIDRYQNELFKPDLEAREIEFDVQLGILSVRSYYRFGTLEEELRFEAGVRASVAKGLDRLEAIRLAKYSLGSAIPPSITDAINRKDT